MKDLTIQNYTIITAGTGTGYAEPGRGGSALLLLAANSAILLDCGEGAAGWVNHYNLVPKIAAVFISHLHADHMAGLFMLVQSMYLHGRQLPLALYLPEDGIEPVRNMLTAMYLGSGYKQEIFPLHFNPLLPGLLWQNSEFAAQAWLSDHFAKDSKTGTNMSRPAFGFTIESGQKRLVYTADVATIECFTPELQPGSTLISEAAHIDYRAVVRLAFDKQLSKLIFTHIEPAVRDELNEYCRTCHFVTIAGDGFTLDW